MKALGFHGNANGSAIDFAIKALTRSQYCHAAILVDDNYAESLRAAYKLGLGQVIIEAIFPRVQVRILNPSEFDAVDVFDCPSHTSDRVMKSMAWLATQIGVAYDTEDLFRFLPNLRALMGEGSDSAYMKHTFCSMLVFNTYRFGGTCLFRAMHDYECAPGYLFWSPLFTECEPLK